MIVRGPNWDLHPEYRKIHPFDAFADESHRRPRERAGDLDRMAPASGSPTATTCVPEQFTALAQRGAQAILLPLAWAEGPGKREQLQLLLRARALDSTTVVLAADQAPPEGYTGKPARGIGRSAVVGPLGAVRQELGREPGLLLVDLDLEEIAAARAALPVLEHHVELPRA